MDKIEEELENRKSFLNEVEEENFQTKDEEMAEEDLQAKEENDELIYSSVLTKTVQQLKEYCKENGLPLCQNLNTYNLDLFVEKSLENIN